MESKGPLRETGAWRALEKYFEEHKDTINILDLFNKEYSRNDKYIWQAVTKKKASIFTGGGDVYLEVMAVVEGPGQVRQVQREARHSLRRTFASRLLKGR